MYFYRLLTIDEFNEKKVHNNHNCFDDCENTHKYVEGKNYIHLFLNAESCFEDFEKEPYHKCYVARFNIPDEIVCKYGIGLGGYNPIYNAYNRKYRVINLNGHFWLPEIAIPSDDFDYKWCEELYSAVDKNGNCYLPDNFITDELKYREIICDGYLMGYKNKKELLEKYNNMINLKKHIMDVLKTTRVINIHPQDLNSDSINTYLSLVNYAEGNNFIESTDEIKLFVSQNLESSYINIVDRKDLKNVIHKKYNSTFPTFCENLKDLGLNVEGNIKDNKKIQKVKRKQI